MLVLCLALFHGVLGNEGLLPGRGSVPSQPLPDQQHLWLVSSPSLLLHVCLSMKSGYPEDSTPSFLLVTDMAFWAGIPAPVAVS